MSDYQCVTEGAVASSRLPEFVPFRCPALENCVRKRHFLHRFEKLNKRGKIRPFFTPFVRYSATVFFFVVRWCSTAELTPLRSVRPSYRFLRPRSRENLSPAGTSHFPRPWAGHVRRTVPPDRRHVD